MKKIDDILTGVKTVGISGHIRPDGDCLGSCLGLYNYIKKNFDIMVRVYLEPVNTKFDFLPGFDKVVNDADEDISYDLFFVMDSSDKDRLGIFQKYFDSAKSTFCIDHHISNMSFADDNYILPDASSACEVLYDLLDENKIDKDIAEALYTGIAHDSGIFRYPSTSSKTMRIAGSLMDKGIKFTDIIDDTFYSKTYKQTQILGRILSESILFMNQKCVVGWATFDLMKFYGLVPKDLDCVIDSLRNIEGVECAMFIYQTDELTYKVSLRSKNIVDVSKIAVHFGGGGHVRAAGFNMTGTIHDIINNVSKEIESQLNKKEL
ncbi:MAG: bifunctional oligoribonuclease/PAP phosphatase NrnA [Eubacterium sp.]